MMQTYPMPKQRKFRFNRRLHNKTGRDVEEYNARRRKRLANSPTHDRTPASEKTHNSRGFSNPVEPHPGKLTPHKARFARKIHRIRFSEPKERKTYRYKDEKGRLKNMILFETEENNDRP